MIRQKRPIDTKKDLEKAKESIGYDKRDLEHARITVAHVEILGLFALWVIVLGDCFVCGRSVLSVTIKNKNKKKETCIAEPCGSLL